jgi:2-polyprenyl-6-methoxyphenol hydroxylase-like FAD-dependent oxidoreductase
MFDVIVVGARVAGSATAMLLARKGLEVLVVDRAAFPSDTLSTHQVQPSGGARLRRWGLLDAVVASNAPAARRVRFDQNQIVLDGSLPNLDGVDAVYSPRRTVLDAILVDAARAAGAEVRENFVVDEILFEDGRAAGIRGHGKGSGEVTERARLIVGADGKHSLVARAVRAPETHSKPSLSMAYYTYWANVHSDGGEIYNRPRRSAGAWPTNDGLLMTFVSWPASEFRAFRDDIEGNFLRTLDLAGDLGERVRSGERVERFLGTADLPNVVRRPYGPGWALVGDAGLVVDPITAQGISDAFRDAELLADAAAAALDRGLPPAEALAPYEKARNDATLPMWKFTTELASFKPSRPEDRVLFTALAASKPETERFLGVIGGAEPIQDYMTPKNLVRIIGASGMAKMALSKLRRPGRKHHPALAPDTAR